MNEKKIKKMGAIEYGKLNSLILTIAHFVYYGACMTEGFNKGAFFKDATSWVGLTTYALSITILYYVIYQIRYIWTLKLIIGSKKIHRINKSTLFKYFRHPNYYLSIIPELISISLVFHAWYTMAIALPLYLLPLAIRIIQEERIMKFMFDEYE
jgi:isoprenylcysteine carboxyl methyltransferase (ICMT) family protein YpbQ